MSSKMFARLVVVILHLLGYIACELDDIHENPISNSSAGDEEASAAAASSLAKFVLTFSRPGAFVREAHAAFGEDFYSKEVSSCPPGEEGLGCRRMEARRGADECAGGGGCSACHKCEESQATEWPTCCKNHLLCCSNLAAACQHCDQPELTAFCAKRFKRC